MRPHTILENVLEIERIFGDKLDQIVRDPDLWRIAKDVLRDAVTFDFGDTAPTKEHHEFGDDLMQRGLYRTPYPYTFYTARSLGQSSAFAMAQTNTEDLRWMLLIFVECKSAPPASGPSYVLPAHAAFFAEKDYLNRPASVVDLLHSVTKTRRTGEEMDLGDKEIRAGRVLRFALGAASMLMSKDVITSREPAPAKLNAQRAMRGRPAINEVNTVRVVAGAERAYREAGQSFGTHASPRIHWRRGHFRTLHRDDGQRVIPVAPCLVNGNEQARGIVPKEYIVQAQKEPTP